jgi:hypothetical protein
VLLLAAPSVAPPSLLWAQEPEADETPWDWQGELGVSLFFGAAEQTAFTFGAGAERTSEWVELSLGGTFDYGEAQNPETRESFVSKRSWNADMALDYRPEARLSPFVFVSGEGGLERQIDLRVSGGAGAKYRFVHTERARFDVSLAALVERTDPRTEPGELDEIETKGRWSARVRVGRTFGEGRTTFSLVSFYRPAFDDTGDYTFELDSSVAMALNATVALKLSFVDKYDSMAESRGAPSNNDGRLFVSLVAQGG